MTLQFINVVASSVITAVRYKLLCQLQIPFISNAVNSIFSECIIFSLDGHLLLIKFLSFLISLVD